MNRRDVGRYVSVVIGLVFLLASWRKLHFPYEFLGGVYSYELVTRETGVYLSILLPWLEFVVGICLVVDMLTEGALVISAVLCLAFVGAQAWALWQGLTISCSCFGGGEGIVSYTTIGRTIVLLAMSAVSLWLIVSNVRRPTILRPLNDTA